MLRKSGCLALAALVGYMSFQAPAELHAAEAVQEKSSKGSMEGLLDLLRDRGILSGSETEDFKRRMAEEKAQAVAEEVKRQQQLAVKPVIQKKELSALKATLPDATLTGLIDKAGKQQLLTPEEAALVKERYRKRADFEKSLALSKSERLPERDLRSMLEVMKEQGLVGADEAQELTARIAAEFEAEEAAVATPAVAGAAASPKIPVTVVTAERQIPYVRSSMPQEDLVAIIDKAGKQRVLLPWEVAFVKSRYMKKAGLDQVAEAVSTEVRTEMKAEVGKVAKNEVTAASKIFAAPEWTKRIRLGGDFRLRYEGTFFDKSNYTGLVNAYTMQLINTQEDRQRFRIRARLNTDIKINEDVNAVIGLATGTITDPVSTNQTIGNYFNKKAIQLDQAYVAWKPGEWLTLLGGHFPNPWLYTDLVWDSDLNFDGVAAKLSYNFTPSFKLFLTGGAFPIQEIEFSQREKWLFGGQLVGEYKQEEGISAKLGVAYYSYSNIAGKVYEAKDLDNYSAPQFMQKGNTTFNLNPLGTSMVAGLAADFGELNITGSLDLGFWHPVHLVLTGDYVNNLGFDRGQIARRVGVSPGDVTKAIEGYQLSLMAGYPKIKELLDWKAYIAYKRLEADAVLDAFTDSDFHLGGTNAKGWILGGELGLLKNTFVSARWMSTNEISGPKFAVDLFQLDFNFKF